MNKRKLAAIVLGATIFSCGAFALSACNLGNENQNTHTAHNWSTTGTDNNDGTHKLTCSGCTETKNETHVYDNAEDMTCNVCNHDRTPAQQPADEYTITYNANGHGTAPAAATTTDGKITLASISAGGWIFGGWYDNADCTGNAVTNDTVYTKNTTLYAKWTEDVHVYTGTVTGVTLASGTNGVTISENKIAVDTDVTTIALNATVAGTGDFNNAVTWSVVGEEGEDEENLAVSVSSSGVVTVKAVGVATVVATSVQDSTKKASVEITVTEATIKGSAILSIATPATFTAGGNNEFVINFSPLTSNAFKFTYTGEKEIKIHASYYESGAENATLIEKDITLTSADNEFALEIAERLISSFKITSDEETEFTGTIDENITYIDYTIAVAEGTNVILSDSATTYEGAHKIAEATVVGGVATLSVDELYENAMYVFVLNDEGTTLSSGTRFKKSEYTQGKTLNILKIASDNSSSTGYYKFTVTGDSTVTAATAAVNTIKKGETEILKTSIAPTPANGLYDAVLVKEGQNYGATEITVYLQEGESILLSFAYRNSSTGAAAASTKSKRIDIKVEKVGTPSGATEISE